MSGKGPTPQAPKMFKGKVKVTLALEPKAEVSQAAQLTVLPSNAATRPEDEGPAVRYEGIAERRGMFSGVRAATAAPVPGKPTERRKLTVAERLARPLADDESEGEEEFARAVAEEAPLPPPVVKKAELPPVAKQTLGLASPGPRVPGPRMQEKKSYAEDAVKKRFTDEIADTLLELGEQLEALKFGGLDFNEGTGFAAEEVPVDGKTKFTFDEGQGFEETPKLTEEKLKALDDLFPSLRIRMNHLLGEGFLEAGSTSPVAKDYQMLKKLIAYATTFKKDKPKLMEKQRVQAAKEMLTDELVDVLLELEQALAEMTAAGVGMQTMTETLPSDPAFPTVYEFDDGNMFLPVEDTPEAKRKAEQRLSMLNPLFPGGSKISLTKMIGVGPYDEVGTPLYNDLAFLTELFGYAKEYKAKATKAAAKVEAVVQAEEAARVKTLDGTEFATLAKPIQDEMTKSPYEITTTSDYKPGTYKDKKGKDSQIEKQKGFIPPTRRAFGYFIYDKFRRYMLQAMEKLDPNACKVLGDSSSTTQIYEYQKFVRDYISYMTPYRGVLVYHGLGSGKTCTAIAASEALLSSGGKRRIIVMTPFSLRKNFIQQITFCGFRHFRLLNYWTPHEYKASDGKNALWLFATSVLRIPESYLIGKRGKTTRIWIPDLNKPQSEENYSKLTGAEQGEIRTQIYETLVYDPYKGKNGLIWFVNYNGITATRLRDLACKVPSDAFDNSVIVVDEIHNLIRLMQGTVDPYLKKITLGEMEAETKGDAKYLDPDRITSGKWRPKYCGKTMNYKRGYLFYRLLTEAKNSKIVGLSGTPLINFPEELGILANVLHGYNFLYTASIPKISEANGNKRIEEGLKQMADGKNPDNFCPHMDFFEVTSDDRRGVIDFNFTFLPEGYTKIQGQLGVERIPFSDALDTTEQKLTHVRSCIDKVLKGINTSYSFTRQFKERAEPILPVMGEPSTSAKQLDDSFKGRFVAEDGVTIMNEQILLKRLNGLISYYKGSRKDLMPQVTEDTIVRVPMSLDQQRKYIAIRLAEIKIEEKKAAKAKGPADAGKGDDAELKKLSSSQNYRMASRQACNFVFPDGFTRPRPQTAEEAKQSDEFGGSVEELLGDDQAPEQSALVGTKEEEDAATAEDKRLADEAAKDDERISREQEEEEVKAKRAELAGKLPGEIETAVKEIRDRYEMERQGGVVLAGAEDKEELSEALSPEQKRCMANLLPGETYQIAINRSKECLLKYALPKLSLVDPGKPSPLGRWSPKYKAILEKIEEIPGSSLVYSQFLGMEGIGIFTIVMQANGYAPIKIISREGQFMFDEASEAAIRKGPGAKINRFILFTGGEEEEIRKINIDIFNAKFTELPPRIKQVLQESGFTDEIGNKRGELCRVFCITAAGAEGLSLKNVRGVHIMEPYWNDVRMAQVKGRAVRICSHQDLPLKDRTVEIFTYLTVFDATAQDALGNVGENEKTKWAIPQEIWNRDSMDKATARAFGLRISETKGEYAMTSDERLFYISEKKKKLVENLIVIMKTAAADCLLNYKENRDGTFVCRLLGNEGDFLYHPNLQRDIETSKNDDIGDIFKVPEEELRRVKEAEAKLVFEGEEEETKEDAKEEEKETKEETKEGDEVAVPKAVAAPPPPAAAAAAVAAPKRISYPVKIGGKEYVVSALPDTKGSVAKFLIFAGEDKAFSKPLGKADAEFDAAKKRWLPKKGTVVLDKV